MLILAVNTGLNAIKIMTAVLVTHAVEHLVAIVVCTFHSSNGWRV